MPSHTFTDSQAWYAGLPTMKPSMTPLVTESICAA